MDGTEGYVKFEVLIGPDGSVLDVKGNRGGARPNFRP